MALMYAKYPYPNPIEKAVKLVMSRQRSVSMSLKIVSFIADRIYGSAGWFMATRSHRRGFQQDVRYCVPQFQVFVPDLDAG
jgi:hypothetical protein